MLDPLVRFFHADPHRFGRIALQVQIERGVHAIRAGLEIGVRKLLQQSVVHQIDEIRSVGRLERGLPHQLQRRTRSRARNPRR